MSTIMYNEAMKIICSPTKTMKCQFKAESTQPVFLDQANQIIKIMKQYTVDELKRIYKCNDSIALENWKRYQSFPIEEGNALFSFTGIQFKSMQINDWNTNELEYAQNYLRIMSGLYGCLAPFDKIGSYRLDLDNKISLDVSSIYQNLVYEYLKDEVLLDCTSLEYSRLLPENKIRIEFRVCKNGKQKNEATASKMARGKFIRYCVKHQINELEQCKSFNEDSYSFDEKLSSKSLWIFVKEIEK